ncbi:MAG: ABC transporter ATP-binding protein [Rhodothermaceae bacterium]|nr:ABC transporter ATP-binding protein [Rhodothermaceae bacterium]
MGRPKTLRATLPGLGRTLRLVWPYTRRHRPLLGGAFAALFASVALRALEPWPLKLIFDQVLVPEHAATGGFLGGLSPMALLGLAALAIVAIAVGRAWMNYLNRVGFALVGNRVLTDVRGDLYRHLQCLSLSFHSRTRAGDLVIRVIADIGMLQDVVVTALMPLVGSVLILVLMGALLLTLNVPLALLVLATLPLFLLPTTRLTKRIHQASRDQRRREGAMASTASESIHAIRVVQALALEERFAETFGGANRKSLKEGVKTKRLSARLEGFVQALTGLATALVLGYGVLLVLRGTLTPGDLLVFLSYLKAMFKPMQAFAKYTGRLAKAAAAGERVADLFERQPEVTDAPHAQPAPPLRGHVAFESVTFGYEPEQPVLRDVSLTVRPGQRVALVGPSGHGKSTLLSLLSRLYDVTDGAVRLDGHDVRNLTLASLRGQVAVVLQDNLLFAASIRDNIAYGAPDATEADIEWAARLANAHDFIVAMPEGYDTTVSERGVTLSAGQRQRLAIARAAVRQTPLLLLDEPTTGLDEDNERAVVDALDRLAQGRTTFLVTHDLRHAERCDLILYLRDGRIAEAGSHAELMAKAGRYARLYRLESTDFAQAPSLETA